MRRFQGIGASDGIAVGQARIVADRLMITDKWIAPEHVADELRRFEAGIDAADEQLAALSRRLDADKRHEGQAIVEAHRLILRKQRDFGGVRSLIGGERLAAASAVRRVVDRLAATFDHMDDQYLRERGADIEAVGERLPDVGAARSRNP